MAQGNSSIIVDTLTDNTNRAYVGVRTAVTKKGGKQGAVLFNFTEAGVLEFKGTNKDEIEETLIMNDVDVNSVELDEDYIVVNVAPTALNAAKEALKGLGIEEFETAEIQMVPNDYVELSGEDAEKFRSILDSLDEVEDVQAVWHNVKFAD